MDDQLTAQGFYDEATRGVGFQTQHFGPPRAAKWFSAPIHFQGAGLMTKRGIQVGIPGFGRQAAFYSRQLPPDTIC